MSLIFSKEIYRLEDANLYQGLDPEILAKLEHQLGFVLPRDHRTLLEQTNGLEAYGGYLRLFGLKTSKSIDALTWNEDDYWKFAWNDRCSEYWCFGETGWGDQYGYRLESLRSGKLEEVYFLSAFSMTPQIVANSFQEFMENEWLPSAKMPYDVMTRKARETLGPLEVSCHLIYIPSILLGGSESIENVRKINARTAMILNGDIAVQLDQAVMGVAVKAVEPYEDEKGRMRVRLLWD